MQLMDTFIRHLSSQHKIEKTDRQTDKLCTDITEEKTEIKMHVNARYSNADALNQLNINS